MKRTEYIEQLRNIKCSEKFKADMERRLSSEPQEIHEYEDSVQGVERVSRFNVSRFGALAAALIIIGGGVGFGLKSMGNIRSADPMSNTSQEENAFPYNELFDLYSNQQIHGDLSFAGCNDELELNELQSSDLNNRQIQRLFDIFQDNSWFSIDSKDMSNDKNESNIVFVLHPNGYEHFTGVYYIFQIFDNGDAYFIKYDMADDSLPDHIVSECCYMFTQDVYQSCLDILSIYDEESPFGDLDEMNMHFYFMGDIASYEKENAGFTTFLSNETRQGVKDLLMNVKWESSPYEEMKIANLNDYIQNQFIVIGFDMGDDINEIIVTDDGKLIAGINNEDGRIYEVGTELYQSMKNIIDNNDAEDVQEIEYASQDAMNEFIDENITDNISFGVKSSLIQIHDPARDSKYNVMNICEEVEVDNLDAVKEKMKSVQWEKCDPISPYTDEYADSANYVIWNTGKDLVEFTDNGLLSKVYTSNKDSNYQSECYRPANREDAEEIFNMLFNENLSNTNERFRLLSALTKGYNFNNLNATYAASYRVPAEISESGESYYLETYGDMYIDKENGGMLLEGKGETVPDRDGRGYLYMKYPNGRIRYDEKKGGGESTAHYDGILSESDEMLPELDYIGLYKQIIDELGLDSIEDSSEKYDFIKCISDEENPDGRHTYTFKLDKKTLNIIVDDKGRLLLYTMLDSEGIEEFKFEINDGYSFDADNFTMPDTYELNK